MHHLEFKSDIKNEYYYFFSNIDDVTDLLLLPGNLQGNLLLIFLCLSLKLIGYHHCLL